jgi:GNAT superfamily N-acetyltransferase
MSNKLQFIREWNSEEITYVREHLNSFNSQFTSNIPFSKPEPINIILKEDDSIIAGLIGLIYWGCFHVDILWVDENYRTHGYGTELLKKCEEIARENNCNFIHLDTLSFQAKGFYMKNGYSVFGELTGYPEGIERYYMKKEL